MAYRERRRPENAPGDFFVDETCIDCDTCRWMVPEVFGRSGEQAYVHAQPATPELEHRALMALISCPTSSIGAEGKHDVSAAVRAFPDPIAEGVYHCGFHQEESFGAASYLLVRRGGNILIDVPRLAEPLAEAIDRLGGVQWLFLTHKDDVAGHERARERFDCNRVVHEADATGALRDAERVIRGHDLQSLGRDLTIIPTPGHTQGSMCLLHGSKYLFTGDHLAHSARLGHLYAFRSACWFDWRIQIDSVRRLAEHPFEWVLPGHGRRAQLAPGTSAAAIGEAVSWMETAVADGE